MLRVTCTTILIFVCTQSSAGQLFRCADAAGKTSFSDSPCTTNQKTVSQKTYVDSPKSPPQESYYLKAERERKQRERYEKAEESIDRANRAAQKQQEFENKMRMIEALKSKSNRMTCRKTIISGQYDCE